MPLLPSELLLSHIFAPVWQQRLYAFDCMRLQHSSVCPHSKLDFGALLGCLWIPNIPN